METILNSRKYWIIEDSIKKDLGNKIKEKLESYRGVDWLEKAKKLYKLLISII